MRPRSITITALTILVAANIGLGIITVLKNQTAGKTRQSLSRLPVVRLRDEKGHMVDTTSWHGTSVFVAFAEAEVTKQTMALMSLSRTKFKRPIHWLIWTTNSAKLRERVPSLPQDAIVVENSFRNAKAAFGFSFPGEWLLFDEDGMLRQRSLYDEPGTIQTIEALVNRSGDLLSYMLLQRWFQAQYDSGSLVFASPNGPLTEDVVVLLGKVSTECPIMDEIELLKKVQRQRHENVSILGIVHSSLFETDILRMVKNLGIDFPVVRSTPAFDAAWRGIEEKYGPARVDGAAFWMHHTDVQAVTVGAQPLAISLKKWGITS